ncbi:coiled-coil domain-containing protein 121 isoform X2 [Pogona vitticeps]
MSTKRQGKKKGQPRRMVPTATGAGAEGPVQDEAAVMLLQEQYERICHDLEHLRRQRGQLQAQHRFLQQEGQELHVQSQEFLGYLGKRAQWRQGLAFSLSEENQALLAETQQHHQELLACMKAQEEGLHKQLLQKEAELAHLTSELEGLRWVQDLQKEQARHIQVLQQELATARKQQLERLQAAKTRFLQEKAAHEQEVQRRAGLWVQEAQGAASRSLQEHSQAVRQQNQELRQELYRLVQRVQKLQAYKHHLQQKVQHLHQEHGFLQDLIPLHSRVGRWMVGP